MHKSSAPPDMVAAPIVVSLSQQHHRQLKIRKAACAGAVLAGCFLWYVTLGKLGATVDGMPWYLTCGVIAVICARAVVRPVSQFVVAVRGAAIREPLSLSETWAGAYLIASALLFAWVLIHSLLPPAVAPKLVQVVDIQLTDSRDYADRSSPMPGTVEAPEMHKRHSDAVSSQGTFEAKRAPNKPHAAPAPAKPQIEVPPQISETPLITPTPFLHVSPPPARKPEPSQQIVLEEVEPPELVEMIENDGTADATSVFQAGGSTTGGKGAANELSAYIKELHKRIKSAWSPPRGQSRQAVILFRIKKDGRLAFCKINSSSGDTDTDEAALKAITTALQANKQLPDDYAMPYLDVQYTFKYTADELKEVKVVVH